MKIILTLVTLSLLPLAASASGSSLDHSKVSANAINCYPNNSYPVWHDNFPCSGNEKVHLKLDTGNFALWPQETDGRYFDDFIKANYIQTNIQKDASGKLKITADIAGQVGVMEDGGNGAYCLEEESSNNLIRPSAIVDGKISTEKMSELALKRAVNECKSQGGSLTMDGTKPLILSESNRTFRHVRKIFPSTCLSSSIVIECDISNHATEILSTYKKFRSEYPTNALSNNPRFELLK